MKNTLPNIKLINIDTSFPLKKIQGEEFSFEFEGRPDLDYDIWTNINSAKFESYPVTKLPKNKYIYTTKLKTTGFFKVFIRYKNSDNKSYSKYHLKIELHVDPSWIDNAIVYNIFLRAYGAKTNQNTIRPGQGGTFGEVVRDIDHFVDLGINTIYINPFHLIGELYKKYNPADHLPYYLQPGSPYSIRDPKSIDPEIAFDQQDKKLLLTDPQLQFRKFVDAAHKRGMRVIMDLVFNHTSHDFVLQRIYPEWFLYKLDITSAEDPYIYPEEISDGKPWGDAKHTVVPFDHGEFSWTDTAQLNWEYMLPPAPNQPPPNTKKREMYEYFKSVPKYWVKEFGVDGFRCDVAYKIPSDFWYECISETRQIAKECYPSNGSIDGEVIFIAESFNINIPELFSAGFTYVYGDYSNKIYRPENLKGYLDYIYNLSGSHFPKGSKWFIFPECHDFHRATSKLVPSFISDDFEGLSDKEEAAMRANISRWVLTACLPGMPMLFNGFEKIEWSPVDHVSYSKIDWEKAGDIVMDIKQINTLRHQYQPLKNGEYKFIESMNGLDVDTKVFAFARYNKTQTLIIVVNMDIVNKAEDRLLLEPTINFDPNKPFILKDLLTNKIYHRTNDRLEILLEPGQSHIFLVEQEWG